jgi:hypothetical protein
MTARGNVETRFFGTLAEVWRAVAPEMRAGHLAAFNFLADGLCRARFLK